MKTDRELLHDFCRRRSQPAFRELVERHLDWVYSVALRQVGQDRHMAEDVCQEVFASVSRKAEQLGELDALTGWLFRATRFAASDVVRAERRRKNREWEAAKMDLAEKAGGSELDWQETGALLDEAIGELRDEDRDALCLRYFEERSFAEVGARLGVQENAARMRVNRALDKLQLVLQQRGVKSTAAALGGVCAGHSLVSAPASLLASVSVSSASAVSGIGLLGAGKVLLGGLVFVGALGIGSAVFQYNRNVLLEQELSQSMAERADLENRLEQWEKTIERPASKSEVSSPAVEGSQHLEERLDVMARLKRADGWKEEGRLHEALEEYFWLFDNGVRERASFSGVRSSSVLSSIVRIGNDIPSALSGLRQRRDEVEEDIFAAAEMDDSEGLDFLGWKSINRELGETERSLSVFDALDKGKIKDSLRIFLRDELIAEKRYEDAIRPGYLGSAKHQFDMMKTREPSARFTEERRAQLLEQNRKFALKKAASDIELLAGAGQWLEAVELTKDVLVFDSSEETISLLTRHLERADALQVLEQLD